MTQTTARSATSQRTPLQQVAGAVGLVFLLVGALGFVPGITTNVDDLAFAGHESGAELLGLFQVSVLHNVVHLLFGAAGLTLARSLGGARAFLLGGGAVYLVLAVFGMVIDLDHGINFVPVNHADNWLHLALGAAMAGLGALLGAKTAAGVRR